MTSLTKICSAILVLVSFFIAPTLVAEPFKVGVIVPLSGPLAEYGMAIVNGITLAKEQYPEKLKSRDFSIEDSAYKTTQALAAFNKFHVSGEWVLYTHSVARWEKL